MNEQEKAWARYLRLMQERPELFRQSAMLRIVTDRDTVLGAAEQAGRIAGAVYESRYSLMVVDLVEDAQGRRFFYERLVPVQTGGIVSVPVFEGKFVLLEQYRHALREVQLAFPRGFGEPGITPEQNLRKELSEELGADVLTARFLGRIAPDSGMSSTVADVYACTVTEPAVHFGNEGIRRCLLLDEAALREKIRTHAVTDGFTLAAFALYCAG